MIDKVRVNIYITKDVKEQASQLAERLGISFSGLVNVALNDYIKQDKVKDMASLFEQLRDIEVGIQANGEKPKA